IAVHGGAGHLGRSQAAEIKLALKRACSVSIQSMMSGECDGIAAVSLGISVMEDDGSLNAGYGSNLNIEGNVECDASIYAGADGAFGAVAAVSGIKNPIKVAQKILEQSRIPSPMGMIRPLMLASQGAVSFAQKTDIRTVSPEELITPRATQNWKTWKWRMEEQRHEMGVPEHDVQDTVGAVALDSKGRLAAGVSSGGILLKQPGRIGEENSHPFAAVYGAGCWAWSPDGSPNGVASSVSGQGEAIIRLSLARRLGEMASTRLDEIDEIIKEIFEQPRNDNPLEAGTLLLVKEAQDDGTFKTRLWCAFTTASMAIAFATSERPQPQVRCRIITIWSEELNKSRV
ncbi:nucleophile aminohydrolase, partial [Cantharellus anzutake]|uniref:nucleophile aminohydrolase n=1 Tax=Cantharellus anzutake TaxID=1750568 RepID=UPI001904D16A